MITVYLILILITSILYAIYWRIEKDAFVIAAVVVGIAATIVAMVATFTSDSSSGAYIHYVNGVRVSSGFMNASSFFPMLLIFGGISIGLTSGIGYFIGHKRDSFEKQQPKVWKLILSIIGLQFGGTLLLTGIAQISDIKALDFRNFLVIALGIAILGLSIWGIIGFIIKKKRTNGK